MDLRQIGGLHDCILQLPAHAVEKLGVHAGVLGAAEELQVDRLADHGRHVGVGHGRGPSLGAVDKTLTQTVQSFFPRDRRRVEVHQVHRDAAKLRARHPVAGAEKLFQRGHRFALGEGRTHLQAAQFGMAEEEFHSVTLLQRIAQKALRLGRIEEVILIRARTEHVGVIQHVQIGCGTGGVLCRCRIEIDNAQLRLLKAVQLAADLVVPDELDPDRAVGTLFKVTGEFKHARTLDQQVALVEACRAKGQRVLRLGAVAAVVGGFHGPRERRQRDRTGQGRGAHHNGRDTICPREFHQIAARYLRKRLGCFHLHFGLPPNNA
mmetsp:Transcript_3376/g.5862  ORF Transcript_3376/g.5862 Transcript_3376/m.5862 type:complete len:321 (-) Transcript_3376:3-965(-)